MNTYCLIIFSSIILLHSINTAQASSYTEPERQLIIYNNISSDERSADQDTEVTTNLRSWRGRSTPRHQHLKNVRTDLSKVS